MDRVFSVEEISGQLWSSSPAQRDDSSKMNRSASEWAFQRFLQEAAAAAAAGDAVSDSSAGDDNDAVLEIEQQSSNQNQNLEAKEGRVSAGSCSGPGNGKVPFNAPPPPNVSIDSEDYQAFLKNKLNLACAAVALSRVSSCLLSEYSCVGLYFYVFVCTWLVFGRWESWRVKWIISITITSPVIVLSIMLFGSQGNEKPAQLSWRTLVMEIG